METYFGWAVLVGVAMIGLVTGQSQESCRGQDGHPGEKGFSGRDGLAGLKGEKGDSALASAAHDSSHLLKLKGERGHRGPPGEMGLKGYRGDLGPEGPPGAPGVRGSDAVVRMQGNVLSESAFSVVRDDVTYPAYNQKVTFETALFNQPADFNLKTGMFTCRVRGAYYFVFHASSTVDMCLYLISPGVLNSPLGFCDYNNRQAGQILSGGVVLELNQGQKVWLESFKDQQAPAVTNDIQEKKIIFNGFLLFPTA